MEWLMVLQMELRLAQLMVTRLVRPKEKPLAQLMVTRMVLLKE
jgi:hypothetical protein